MSLKTYQGACHCGFIKFEVEANIDHVRICDCSICHQRGGLMFRVAREALRLITPDWPALRTYQWGSFTATDFFCPTCGILPFRHPSAPNPEELAQGAVRFTGFAINTRCLKGFDPADVPVRQFRYRDAALAEPDRR